jgi:hypothetical protein
MPVIPYRTPGSAEAGPSLYIARNRLNNAFVRDLFAYWGKSGDKLIERVAAEQPGTLLKCLTMLCPKEVKLEHTNPVNGLSDESLAMMVMDLEERISARLTGESAKVINAQAVPAAPKPKPKQSGAARRQAAYRKRKAAAAGTPGPSDTGA